MAVVLRQRIGSVNVDFMWQHNVSVG